MIEITWGFIGASFVAGVLTFLAPCTFPLIPAYLGFITGEMGDHERPRISAVMNGLFFVLGFTVVFVGFGVFAVSFARWLGPDYREILSRIGGVVVIFFGLSLAGVFRLPILQKTVGLRFPRYMTPGSKRSSFLLGVSLAFGWSPCIGPILGSILTLTINAPTAFLGVAMMLVFSAGLAVPFLLTALLIGSAKGLLRHIEQATPWISKLSGVILILLGIILITNNFGWLLRTVYDLLEWTGYRELERWL